MERTRLPTAFSFKVVPKDTHPWKYLSPNGYTVSKDGGPFVEGDEIWVQDGVNVTFTIDAPDHPFYISRSPIGGPGFPAPMFLGDTGGVEKGSVTVRIPEGFALTREERDALGRSNAISMYYQCGHHRRMGGRFVISAENEWMDDPVGRTVSRGDNQTLAADRMVGGVYVPTCGDVRRPVTMGKSVDVLEQHGEMYIGQQDGTILSVDTHVRERGTGEFARPSTFLDLSGYVLFTGEGGDERGLVGMAFHPNFDQGPWAEGGPLPGAGHLYVYYSSDEPTHHRDINHYGVLARVVFEPVVLEIPLSPFGGKTYDWRHPTYERVYRVSEPFPNHNGGSIAFGPTDGYLYLGLGDGGSQGDPLGLAAMDWSVHGKILRMDVTRPFRDGKYRDKGHTEYMIPRTNPWADAVIPLDQVEEVRSELFLSPESLPLTHAAGFRNVWGMDFRPADRRDPGQTVLESNPIVGDVGWKTTEEINLVFPGLHYGWPYKEGHSPGPRSMGKRELSRLILANGRVSVPYYSYAYGDMKEGFAAVIGGKYYLGTEQTKFHGYYIFGDYSGQLFANHALTGPLAHQIQLPKMKGHLPPGVRIHGFVRDVDGEVYAMAQFYPSDGSKPRRGQGSLWHVRYVL